MNDRLEDLRALPTRELDCRLAEIFHNYDDRGLVAREGFLCTWKSDDAEPDGYRYTPVREVPRYSSTWEGMGEALGYLRACGYGAELWHPARAQVQEPCLAVVSFADGHRNLYPVEATADELPRAMALAIALTFDAQ
jgi:hypothetical protein